MFLGLFFEEHRELVLVLFSHVGKILGIDLSLSLVAFELIFVHSDFAFQIEIVLLS